MFVLCNIAILALTILIAYWWANQGLFSAILHLLCVIAAGAIALGVWEPLTHLVLFGNQFDDYAWGIVLVTVFTISLLILRVAVDKLAPDNVQIPHWANLVFGFPVGLAAAVLTTGILIIGIGFVQTQKDFMGIDNWQRKSSGKIEQVEPLPIWTMAHQITDGFYSRLSGGALSTRTPLRQYNPELWKQASLIRDGFNDTRGRLVSKTTLKPSAGRVREVIRSTELDRVGVVVSLDRAAFDGGGQQIALSSAQVRLIGQPSGSGSAPIAYPVQWSQRTAGNTIGSYLHDTASHYMTSVPASENVEFWMEFNLKDIRNTEPRFIQVRGTRYALPRLDPAADVSSGQFQAMRFTLGSAAPTGDGGCDSTKPTIKREEIDVSNRLPFVTGKNTMPGGVNLQGNTIFTSASADFPKNADRPPRALQVDTIFEQAGAKIVLLDVSVRTSASLYGPLRREVGDDVTPLLVDSSGMTYRAIGYLHDRGQVVRVFIDRVDGVGALNQLPELPSSGSEKLSLIFEVTDGVTLTCFRVNNIPVANVGIQIHGDRRMNVRPEEEEETKP